VNGLRFPPRRLIEVAACCCRHLSDEIRIALGELVPVADVNRPFRWRPTSDCVPGHRVPILDAGPDGMQSAPDRGSGRGAALGTVAGQWKVTGLR
jgi:hypothetical protein